MALYFQVYLFFKEDFPFVRFKFRGLSYKGLCCRHSWPAHLNMSVVCQIKKKKLCLLISPGSALGTLFFCVRSFHISSPCVLANYLLPNTRSGEFGSALNFNCRAMRGLRRIVFPQVFRPPVAARFCSASPNSIAMSKKNSAASSEGSGEQLPALSASDFQVYNRMAEQMNGFVSFGLANIHW